MKTKRRIAHTTDHATFSRTEVQLLCGAVLAAFAGSAMLSVVEQKVAPDQVRIANLGILGFVNASPATRARDADHTRPAAAVVAGALDQ